MRKIGKIGGAEGRLRPSALPFLLGLLASVALIACWAGDPFGFAGVARERMFDSLYQLFPREQSEDRIQVVDIDQETLRELGAWPLPRASVGTLVKKLADSGAAVVALDIFFAEEDQSSSQRLADMVGKLDGGAQIAPAIRNLPDSDLAFARILQSVASVLGALAVNSNEQANFNPIIFKPPFDPAALKPVAGFTPAYSVLADAALGIGVMSLFGEEQGLVRRVPLLLWDGTRAAPGLALETARIATGVSVLEVSPGTRQVQLPNRPVAIADLGSMRIHWSDAAHWKRRTHSAIDILAGKVDPLLFAGAIVLVGSSAPQTGSLRPTPVNALTPSVQIEAEAIEQLLKGQAPWRPVHAQTFEGAASLVLAAAAVFGALISGPALGIAALALVLLLWLGICLAAFLHGILLDPLEPSIAAILAANVAAGLSFARTRRLKALITQRFAQYLSPEIVAQIAAEPARLRRAGENRVITALFTDIEGFTAMSKRLQPNELIALLDRYFDGLCHIVLQHKGMINGFAGDAIQVFFNVPLEQEDHADAAIFCALEIRRFSEQFRASPQAAAARFGRTRIGIETGAAIVGDVGGSRRLNYTAYGDVVNLTARLEAMNKQLESDICIGPGAAAAIRKVALVRRAVVSVRGFDEAFEVYTPAEAEIIGPFAAPPESGPDPRREAPWGERPFPKG